MSDQCLTCTQLQERCFQCQLYQRQLSYSQVTEYIMKQISKRFSPTRDQPRTTRHFEHLSKQQSSKQPSNTSGNSQKNKKIKRMFVQNEEEESVYDQHCSNKSWTSMHTDIDMRDSQISITQLTLDNTTKSSHVDKTINTTQKATITEIGPSAGNVVNETFGHLFQGLPITPAGYAFGNNQNKRQQRNFNRHHRDSHYLGVKSGARRIGPEELEMNREVVRREEKKQETQEQATQSVTCVMCGDKAAHSKQGLSLCLLHYKQGVGLETEYIIRSIS